MGSIPVGSTKKQTQACLLLLSLRRIERLLTQPDSRALDKLADEREYKKQTQTCLLLLSRLEIEGRRSVVPIPVRSAGSLIHGSTKMTVKTVVFI